MTPVSRASLALDIAEELESVRNLPEHIPGRIVTVPLWDLPMYLVIHGLRMSGERDGIFIVKKEEQS